MFAANGPEVLAKVILDSADDPEKVMEERCLASGLGSRGFSARGFAQGMAVINQELRSGGASLDRLNQLFRWALTGEGRDRELRYPGSRARLPEALLEPFNTSSPGPEAQQRIKNFLLDHYGDPRLSKGMWQGTNREAQEVMFRWLVQATLEDFFRFLDHVAKHSNDKQVDRHWRYRRAFWTAYLEAGMIEEAWVTFGPEARQEARHRLEGLKNNYSELQSGGGAKSNHAVLLLRIGDLVITEWSHMGKFRSWHVDNDNAPRFYRRSYRRGQVVHQPDFEGSHQGSESGSWQRKLSTYIREQTGFSIPMKDLMP